MWLIWSLVTLVLWGLWGFLTKYALTVWTWRHLFILGGVASFLYALLFALLTRPTFAAPPAAWVLALAVVSTGSLGAITFYLALEQGKAAVVLPLTAAYPVVTVVLSVLLLRESLRPTEAAAIVLFLVATLLVSR